jgi:hypothetical protein
MDDPKPQQPATPQCNPKTTGETKVSAPQPPATQPHVNDTIHPDTAASQHKEEREATIDERMSAFERSMVILTRYGVGVGIITLVIFSLQLCEMHDAGLQMTQLRDTADRIKGALVTSNSQNQQAFKDALGQSQRVLDATIDNARLDQRAWAFVPSFKLSDEPKGNDAIRVACAVINSGKTAAISLSNKSMLAIWDGEPPRPDWQKMKSGTSISATVPPGVTGYSFEAHLDLVPKESADDYRNNKKAIYVRALISYSDIFGRPHWTEVCVKHRFGTQLSAFEFCQDGNITDTYYKDN